MAETGDRRIAGGAGAAQPAQDIIRDIGPLLQATATDFTVYNDTGGPVRVVKVRSFLTVTLTTADSVITVKNNGGTSLGTLTITQSSCAVADEDSLEPAQDSDNIIADGEKVILSHDGGPDAGEALFSVVLRPAHDMT